MFPKGFFREGFPRVSSQGFPRVSSQGFPRVSTTFPKRFPLCRAEGCQGRPINWSVQKHTFCQLGLTMNHQQPSKHTALKMCITMPLSLPAQMHQNWRLGCLPQRLPRRALPRCHHCHFRPRSRRQPPIHPPSWPSACWAVTKTFWPAFPSRSLNLGHTTADHGVGSHICSRLCECI